MTLTMRVDAKYAVAVFLAVCIAALLLWSGDERVYACDCEEADSPADGLEAATAVFLGRVVDMRFENWPLEIDSALVPPDEPLTVEFSVRTAWKGDVPQILHLTTARSEPCGYPFKKHQDYLVYADGDVGSLEVRACSGTKPAAEAEHELEGLGDGRTLELGERPVIRPATLDCYANANSVRSNLVSWPLGLIAGIVWCGFRKRRCR